MVYHSRLPNNPEDVLNAKIDALKGNKISGKSVGLVPFEHDETRARHFWRGLIPRAAERRRMRPYRWATVALALQGAWPLAAQQPASAPTVIFGERTAPIGSSAGADSPAAANQPSLANDRTINALILQTVQGMPSGGL